MARRLHYVPGIACFLAGVATAALASRSRRPPNSETANPETANPEAAQELKRSICELEAKLEARESATQERLSQVESTLEAHTAKLADVPSTSQIVAAMEQLLSRTMSSLDDRLTNQAHAIEVLKTTVSQADSLLERVLESLDTLQTTVEAADSAEESLLGQPRG